MVHELGRQPVEERGIRGRGAVQTEVEHVPDQRPAEVARPHVIDGDAGRQRVLG